jgi:osmotically inducible protein OsmC
MEIKRSAEVVWAGDSRHGSGRITSESGALKEVLYTWPSRFLSEAGTNPEELLAAAHAACYTMAFASALSRHGYQVERIATRAVCTMTREESGVKIVAMRLQTRAKVPGIDQARLLEIAQEAERSCPVSNVLRAGLAIELDAALG